MKDKADEEMNLFLKVKNVRIVLFGLPKFYLCMY
jgi:hypothetical protein